MSEHSVLPPSSAARRMACPGSRSMEERFPAEESEHSEEGHLAHLVAAAALTNGEVLQDVPKEMVDGAGLYLREVLRYGGGDSDVKLHVEEKVDISNIHPDCWGTPDCWFIADNGLHIFDYKFGHGFVEVYENWQLLEYAGGLMLQEAEELKQVEGFPIFWIHLHIVQPRNFHKDGPCRTWSIKSDAILYYLDQLVVSERAAMEPVAECLPNPECTYCSARHACPALQTDTLRSVDIAGFNTPHELSTQATGYELKTLKVAAQRLDARITGLEQQAIAKIKKGERIPYFTLEQGLGRERWVAPVDEILALGELYGKDLKKPVDLITPKQAIKQGIPPEVIDNYSGTPRGSLRLTEIKLKDVRKDLK